MKESVQGSDRAIRRATRAAWLVIACFALEFCMTPVHLALHCHTVMVCDSGHSHEHAHLTGDGAHHDHHDHHHESGDGHLPHPASDHLDDELEDGLPDETKPVLASCEATSVHLADPADLRRGSWRVVHEPRHDPPGGRALSTRAPPRPV